MNRRILSIMAFAIVALSFNACSSKDSVEDDGVFLLNKDSATKQQVEASKGSCLLLPEPSYPSSPIIKESKIKHPNGSVEQIIEYQNGVIKRIIEQPDGSIETTEESPVLDLGLLICKNREEEEAKANSVRDSIDPTTGKNLNEWVVRDFSFCDNISKAKLDSLQEIKDSIQKVDDAWREVFDAWQEEVLKVRNDPTRTATVTFSKKQTVINLSPVFVEVILDLVRFEGTQKNDTLYINAVSGKNGSYGQMKGMSSCPISLDIAFNYVIDENIKVAVFGKDQIFQVKRQ